MKKILIIFSLVLMAGSAFGSDVLFKMQMLHTSSVSTAASSSTDLSNYAIVIGGTMEAVNTSASAQNMVVYESSVSYVRISTGSTYLHFTLSEPLQVGDKILYQDNSNGSHHTILMTRANARTRYNSGRNVITAGTEFTVPSASGELAGASEFWIWYDGGTPTYLTSLVITRSGAKPLVTEYFFDAETAGAIGAASSTNNELNNGLKVNNDGSANNAIANLAGSKVLYLAGSGEDRVAMFDVTDPCTIEIWGRSSNDNTRSLFISEGSFKSTSQSTVVTGLSSVARSQLYKGTYSYTGFEDNKTIYMQVDGGFHIAAIRVIYDRIRPDANFSVSPASALLKAGESQLFTFNKDYAGATIDRSAGEGSDANWIGRSEVENVSVTISAKAEGVGHTYMMRLTQVADAYCRQAVVDVPIRIIAANESVVDIDGTIAPLSDVVWESNSITLIEDGKNNNGIVRYGSAVGEFAANTSLRLASGRTYTLSVPSNKQIARLTISGYTVGGNAGDKGSITPEGGSATQFNVNGGDIKVIEYTNINAQKFTFAISGKNVAVKIDLVTTDLGYYPVTISGGWASFCAPEDVALPEGVNAYIVDDTEADALYIKDAEVTKVPANTGVLLYSESDGDYHLTATTGAADLSSGFAGTIARTANPNTSTTYSLYDNNGTIEFWNYTGNYIPANKAYLVYAGSGAPGRTLRVQVRPKVPTTVENAQQTAISSQKVIENGQLVIIREGVKYNAIGQIVK